MPTVCLPGRWIWLPLATLLAAGLLRASEVVRRPGASGDALAAYETAPDEVFLRLPGGPWQWSRAGRAAGPAATAANAAVERAPVLYPRGGPRIPALRRRLSREILARLAPGTGPEAVSRSLPALQGLRRLGHTDWQVFLAPDAAGAPALAAAAAALPGVREAWPQLARPAELHRIPNDPLLPQQWHLLSPDGAAVGGFDLRLTNVWDRYTGRGVVIGIVDDAVEYRHPDLRAKVAGSLAWDFIEEDPDANPSSPEDSHGTGVAGLAAAAGDNALGIAGVAFGAGIAPLRLIGPGSLTDAMIAGSMTHRNDAIAVKNNSWGTVTAQYLNDVASAVVDALQDSLVQGRGGLGTLHVLSAGNSRLEQDDVNYDALKTLPGILPIAAFTREGQAAWYTTPGASLLAGAPGGDYGSGGLVTTDRVGDAGFNPGDGLADLADRDYTRNFGGTSGSAPVAAGVIALMLEANPRLGWRDVQEIIIRSARRVALREAWWQTNAAGFGFHPVVGAGLIDAQAAVSLAERWENLPPQGRLVRSVAGLDRPIPDDSAAGVEQEIRVDAAPFRVEHVRLRVDVEHPARGELVVTLQSPSGMVSELAHVHPDSFPNYPNWTFLSRFHWGELAAGVWKVKVADRVTRQAGRLHSLRLELLGASPDPVALLSRGLVEVPGASDGNGGADPGEGLAEEVTVQNLRGSELPEVRLELRSADPFVTVLPGGVDRLRLPVGATRTNRLGYRLAKSAPCGQPFRLQWVARAGDWARTTEVVRVAGRRLAPVLETNVWEASDGLPLRIPDLTAVEATQRLATAGERVLEDLRVALRVDHTTVGDLEIHLIHPDATEVALALHRGGDHPGLGTGECPRAVRTEYADDAAVPVRSGSVPFAGAYRPEEPLATLRGRGLAGDWRLRLADTYDDDFGILRCWSLTTVSRAVETNCLVFQSAPSATNQFLTTPAGTPLTARLAGGDPDGDPVRFLVDTPPARGQVTLLDPATGEFRYQPPDGFTGEDPWTYRVLDAAGAGPSARVTMRVGLPVPPAPVLADYSVDDAGVFRLRHRNLSALPQVLEASPDLLAWWPVARVEAGLELDYAGPAAADGAGWFFRLR